MEYAIIVSGGKQYKAVPGSTIEVDRLPVEVGDTIEIEDVLLLSDGDHVSVGTPNVEGARVTATAVDQVKGRKIVVFKFKPGNRYRVKRGHRQRYTRLKIDGIETK